MATTTFDKRIVIDTEAAQNLIAIDNEPVFVSKQNAEIRSLGGEELEEFFKRFTSR